jgi:hypothetical protein
MINKDSSKVLLNFAKTILIGDFHLIFIFLIFIFRKLHWEMNLQNKILKSIP